jgi:hypothetical protein
MPRKNERGRFDVQGAVMLRRTLILSLFALLLGTAAFAADKKGAAKTGIEWKVTPGHVVIWLDGKKLGDAGSLTFTETAAGKHAVKLTKGGDETEMEVKVSKGQVVKFEFEFSDG